MTITSAAADVIREWLRSASGVAYPVIYLGVASNTPEAVDKALKQGASRKELEEVTLNAMKSEPKFLYPLVYPGSHFLWLSTNISGFRFAARVFYPSHVRSALRNGVLDAAKRGLLLKDAEGRVVLPANGAGAL